MKTVLQTLNETVEFLSSYEVKDHDNLTKFSDKIAALTFLHHIAAHFRDLNMLRAILVKEENGINVYQLNDSQMLEILAERLLYGRIKVKRTPKAPQHFATGIEPESPQYMSPREVEQLEKTRRGEQRSTVPLTTSPLEKPLSRQESNQEKSHQIEAKIGDFNCGKKIDEGGFGEVFEVEGNPDLAIKIAKGSGGKANSQLETEAKNLQLLAEKGFPTVFKEFVDVVDNNGVRQQAIVMQKVDGVLSKKLLQTGKFSDYSPSAAELKLVNQTTLKQLREFRDLASKSNIVIDDIQFMIDRDGAIKLIDPAKITDLSGLKPKQIKPCMNAFIKRIDKIIRRFENI